MKQHIRKYLMILLVIMLAVGCGEEEISVEIDSLSAMGDEFYYGQKVKVWMAVKTNKLPAARYTWSCVGGKLTQPQSLDENTWQAPRETGTYTVTCTVEVDGVEKTRSRSMWVSSYFFEKFEKSTQSAVSFNSSANSLTNGHLEARFNASTGSRGYVQRAFGDPDLKVPVSTQMTTGWVSNFAANQATVNGTANVQNTLYYEWTLNRDPDRLDNLYIDNIRFEWYPRGRTIGLPLDPGGNPWNGNFRYQQRNVATNATTAFNLYVNHPALTFAQAQYKNVSMSLDADYVAYIYIDGVEIFKTDAIKLWRATNNSQDDIYLNQWRLNYPGILTGSNAATIYVDNAYATNDGTILK